MISMITVSGVTLVPRSVNLAVLMMPTVSRRIQTSLLSAMIITGVKRSESLELSTSLSGQDFKTSVNMIL